MFNIKTPITIVPVPTDDDYALGFIRRHFVQKVNDRNGFIFEISEESHADYLENPFWRTETIKWRISGPIEPTYKNTGEMDDKGVRNSNKAAILLATKTLKNIALYLPNLIQFYK